MATYEIGFKPSVISTINNGLDTNVAHTAIYSLDINNATAYGSTIATKHLVTSNQRIKRLWVAGKALTSGNAGVAVISIYSCNGTTNIPITLVSGATQAIVTESSTIQWYSVDVHIDLASYVGQYVKPTVGLFDEFQASYGTVTSGDGNYIGGISSAPVNWAGAVADTQMYAVYMEVEDTPSTYVTDVSTDESIQTGSTANSYSVSGLTANAITIGGISATSVTSTTFDFPDIGDNITYLLYGQNNFTATDGTLVSSMSINVEPSTGRDYATLVAPLDLSASGILADMLPIPVVGDQLVFDISKCLIDSNGNFQSDFTGTQNIYHIVASDKSVRMYQITTGVVSAQPRATDITKASNQQVFDLINAENSTTFNSSQITLGTPTVNGDVSKNKNTALIVTALGGSGYTGSMSVYYNRLDIGDFALRLTPEISLDLVTTKAQMVSVFNTYYGCNIVDTEIVDVLTPTPTVDGIPYTITAASSNLVYYGSITLNVKLNTINISAVLPNRIVNLSWPT